MHSGQAKQIHVQVLRSNFTWIVIFYIFPVISLNDIVRTNELTLILKIIDQCDDKHIMTLTIVNNNVRFEGLDTHYY